MCFKLQEKLQIKVKLQKLSKFLPSYCFINLWNFTFQKYFMMKLKAFAIFAGFFSVVNSKFSCNFKKIDLGGSLETIKNPFCFIKASGRNNLLLNAGFEMKRAAPYGKVSSILNQFFRFSKLLIRCKLFSASLHNLSERQWKQILSNYFVSRHTRVQSG